MTSMEPCLQLFTPAELQTRPALVKELAFMCNVAWSGREGFHTPRFFHDHELLENLADDSVCAVILSSAGEPVATASIKPWGTDLSGANVELSVVAAAQHVRGKGFADRCVRAVENAAIERAGGREVTLWIKTVEHHNGAYWKRRGFAVVEASKGPAGMWGAEKDFVLLTMARPAQRQ
ncbi:hypothetical protein MPH_06371 [Macrophomina phaseolina MS6]|uniref:N-acetyltransferase domain-containing protein n=2 Tax=Macrophomina phaseolina TaxID=35725 RepID=K2RUL6_MACPH|nr:hypothetical protein MPH_06371 [Macrophomina phaseolina MS6]KAH7063689.1 hypothetical protein B0J12DRAFT_643766 [Macrophomina phaseolina]